MPSVAELLTPATTQPSAPAASDAIPAPPPGFVPANDAPQPPPGFVPVDQAAQPKTIGRGFGLGTRALLEGSASIPDLPTNAIIGTVNTAYLPIGAATKALGGKPERDISYSPFRQVASGIADMIGLPKPQDASERVQQSIAEGIVGAGAGMGVAGALKALPGTAGAVANVMTHAPVSQLVGGAASGAGAQIAAENGAGPLTQLAAGTVAALLGGYGGGRVAGEIPAPTPSAAFKPQGVLSRALKPFTAAASQKAAEAQAGQQIAARASNPQAVEASLNQPGEIVPGSQPTTFQHTGDMGLGALERDVATNNPAAFQQRAAEQNSARRAALGGVETGGDPNDVAKALKQQFEDLNAEHDANVEAAANAAKDKATAALGPEETPDTTGRAVRGVLSDAYDAAKARWGQLFDAVDPDGTLTANVQATRAGADSILADVPATAKPLSGEAQSVFDVARELPPLAPLRDLMALKVRVSDAMAEAKLAGDLQSHRLLTQLRGAIDDNLANSISQEVVSEDRLARAGILDPSQGLAARLKSQVDDWQASRKPGVGGGAGIQSGSVEGSPGAIGVLRTESAPAEGLGSAASAQSIPRNAPTVDAAASKRLALADQTFKEEAPGFRTGPVGDVLKTNGRKDDFRLADGAVAAKFFKPDSTGFERMQAGLAKGGADFLATIERFAAHTLRRAALRPDGTLDPSAFERWQKSYADPLRALPAETRAKFASAAKASETLANAQAERATALKAAQQGAIGKVMGLSSPEDVVRTLGQILGGRTAVSDMKALAKATAGDPIARQGLRRAITDYIASKFVSNTEAGTSEEGLIKADAYQTFIRQNRAALHLVFSPEEVRTMEAVAEDIQRAKRSQNAVKLPGQSNTAQDSQGLAEKVSQAAGKSWLHVLGGALGATHGPFGAAVGVMTAHLTQALRARGIARVDQLVSEAMLDPNLARELLKKAPRKSANWNVGSGPLTAALWGASSTQNTKDARQ